VNPNARHSSHWTSVNPSARTQLKCNTIWRQSKTFNDDNWRITLLSKSLSLNKLRLHFLRITDHTTIHIQHNTTRTSTKYLSPCKEKENNWEWRLINGRIKHIKKHIRIFVKHFWNENGFYSGRLPETGLVSLRNHRVSVWFSRFCYQQQDFQATVMSLCHLSREAAFLSDVFSVLSDACWGYSFRNNGACSIFQNVFDFWILGTLSFTIWRPIEQFHAMQAQPRLIHVQTKMVFGTLFNLSCKAVVVTVVSYLSPHLPKQQRCASFVRQVLFSRTATKVDAIGAKHAF